MSILPIKIPNGLPAVDILAEEIQNVLIPYLLRERINSIDYVFISHFPQQKDKYLK